MAEAVSKPEEVAELFDDNILIKSYDNSITMAKEDLAQRLALATNSRESLNASSVEVQKSSTTEQEPDSGEFKVGDYARATYEDGIDYEATIVAINDELETCLLRYVGYDNEQEVLIGNLIPSWGKKARRAQYEQAKAEAKSVEAATSQSGEPVAPSTSTTSKVAQRPDSVGSGMGGQKRKKSKKSGGGGGGASHQQPVNPLGNLFNFPSMSQQLPQPPVPPMMLRSDGDSEHLAAMLMSWYISGYYTGLYQGMQSTKSQQKAKSKK